MNDYYGILFELAKGKSVPFIFLATPSFDYEPLFVFFSRST